MSFGCSKEPSHRDGSFEYPQYMFWLVNKRNTFQLRIFIWGLAKIRDGEIVSSYHISSVLPLVKQTRHLEQKHGYVLILHDLVTIMYIQNKSTGAWGLKCLCRN